MKKNDQRGFTIIEVMASLVIVSILLVCLTRGISATLNFFEEGNRIKTDGQEVSNSVEGQTESNVEATKKPSSDIKLQNGSNSITMNGKNSTVNGYTHKDKDVTMKDVDTDVARGSEDTDAAYYVTSRNQADTLSKSMTSFWREVQNADNNYGFSNDELSTSLLFWDAMVNKHPDVVDTISETFLTKHKIVTGITNYKNPIHILGFFYNIPDAPDNLCYISVTNEDTYADLIYNANDGYWYVAPRGSGNDKYKTDEYAGLHLLPGAGDNKIPESITYDEDGFKHAVRGNSKVTIQNSSDVYAYITDEKNGWTKLEPVSD